jgi:hypothetical protein
MKLWPHCWCAIYEHIYKKATRGGFYSEESKKKKIVAYQGSNYPYEDDYGDADECLVGIDNEPTIVAIENNIEQLGWKTPYCDTRWKENDINDITCQQIQILPDNYQQIHETRWPNHIEWKSNRDYLVNLDELEICNNNNNNQTEQFEHEEDNTQSVTDETLTMVKLKIANDYN